MPWNEPGNNKPGGKKPNSPFGSGGDKPPEFDKILSDFFNGIKQALGLNSGSGGSGGVAAPLLFFAIAIIALAVWSSAYKIDQPERGVVLVFGKYSHTMLPGLNFTLPKPFATVYRVNIETVRQESNKGQMLTMDKNLVEIDYSIQYRINEGLVNDYLFNLTNPQNTVRQVAESAMRQVAGTSTLDRIINENRNAVTQEVKVELQNLLNDYGAGIEVSQVNITEVHPPINVKEAFDDVVKAREDQKTLINQANEYAKGIIPKAEGRVLKIDQEALAFKESIIAEASGKAQRFTLLRQQYELAPEVTRQRMYLETMEEVLSGTSKVVIDSKNSNNLMYLPLDQMMKKSQNFENAPVNLGTTYVTPQVNSLDYRDNARSTNRGRGN
ncbi:MAG: FtsH protease activity modulator HflK [Proteobacteria bacterium]|nr:FtsH protease activity modulator HflK [Pseudomonadota bacterium]